MSRPKRVLVIEDDDALRRVLSLVLRDEGFEVDAVGSASDAFIRAQRHAPDIVLLDIALPDADGRDVARHLRESGHEPMFVVLTGNPDAARIARQIGATWIPKPFDPDEIATFLTVALDREEVGGTARGG